jgi:hypothetical protein
MAARSRPSLYRSLQVGSSSKRRRVWRRSVLHQVATGLALIAGEPKAAVSEVEIDANASTAAWAQRRSRKHARSRCDTNGIENKRVHPCTLRVAAITWEAADRYILPPFISSDQTSSALRCIRQAVKAHLRLPCAVIGPFYLRALRGSCSSPIKGNRVPSATPRRVLGRPAPTRPRRPYWPIAIPGDECTFCPATDMGVSRRRKNR